MVVSSAGNDDHRLDKAWWVEQWMGYPVGEHYAAQSNATLAPRLRGKLLLMHGELDENVHPASTLRVVDALIKADCDFDLVIFPGRSHNLAADPHFIRRRWDYFVRHLLGMDPPKGFSLRAAPAPWRIGRRQRAPVPRRHRAEERTAHMAAPAGTDGWAAVGPRGPGALSPLLSLSVAARYTLRNLRRVP